MAVVRTGKVATKSVPTPGRTSFVLGSRPTSLRSPTPGSPNIKPQPGNTTQYGKTPYPSVAGAGFGRTGLSGET